MFTNQLGSIQLLLRSPLIVFLLTILISCSSSKSKFLVIWEEVKSATTAEEEAQAIRLSAFLQDENVSYKGIWLDAKGKPIHERDEHAQKNAKTAKMHFHFTNGDEYISDWRPVNKGNYYLLFNE